MSRLSGSFLDKTSRLYPLSGKACGLYAVLDWRWLPVCMFLVYCLLPFIVYGDQLAAGNALVSGDGLGMVYQLNYLSDSLSQGEFPLWNPYLAGGMPYADGSAVSAIYPLKLLCAAVLSPLLRTYAYYGIHLAIGGTFFYLYLRKIDCDAIVSAAVSLIYLFTVHMGGVRKEHLGLQITALWVPVILFFMERYLRERQIKHLFFASGAMALQFIGGFLQYVIYSDIFVFFYLLSSGFHCKIKLKTMFLYGTAWIAAYFGLIMVGVIPLVKLMLLLKGDNGGSMSIETFSILSLHPVKLLMSVFPKLFGPNVHSSMSEQNLSSGMDIELLLGAPCVSLILTGICNWKKSFYVRFAAAAGLCALFYACLGQFVLLREILFRIPVLNMFRVPSRTLFLFTLCCMILLAQGLSGLLSGELPLKRFHQVNLVVGLCMLGIFLLYATSDGPIYTGAERLPVKEVFFIPFLFFFAYLFLSYGGLWLKRRGKLQITTLRQMLPITLALLFLLQVWPYYRYTYAYLYEKLEAWPEEIADKRTAGKVWDPYGKCAFISSNQAISAQVPTLNSYTNFNLPNLYKLYYQTDQAPMNASGQYMLFNGVENALKEKNAFLSMLGVKHIILPLDAKMEQPVDFNEYVVESTLVEEQEAELLPAEGYWYAVWPVTLEAGNWYNVEVTVVAEIAEGSFYVDFVDFAGMGDDFSERVAHFPLQQGKREYQAFISSGNSDVTTDLLFRIIALTNQPLSISDVRVEKIQLADTSEAYRLIAQKSDYSIYENLNAKELFYPAKRIVALTEEERDDIYLNIGAYDILNTSYITNEETDRDFSGAKVEIRDIQLRSNRASAVVETDQETFINMSQTYYPGWNSYVDGTKTKLYEVNGIIQGTFVPAGTHTVEFCYQPASFRAGAFLSATTLALCIFISICEKRARAKSCGRDIKDGKNLP